MLLGLETEVRDYSDARIGPRRGLPLGERGRLRQRAVLKGTRTCAGGARDQLEP